jgi:hypothetical protein
VQSESQCRWKNAALHNATLIQTHPAENDTFFCPMAKHERKWEKRLLMVISANSKKMNFSTFLYSRGYFAFQITSISTFLTQLGCKKEKLHFSDLEKNEGATNIISFHIKNNNNND